MAVVAQAATSHVTADEFVAVLDLKFIKDTEDTAVVMCFGEDQCATWATFYLFEAKVKRVISGEPPDTTFQLIYGLHALRQEDFSNVVAWIKRLEEPHESGSKYQMVEWGEELSLFCFSKEDGESLDVDVQIGPNEQMSCFEAPDRQ